VALAKRYESAPSATLLGEGVHRSLEHEIAALQAAGAKVVTGAKPAAREGCAYANTLLQVEGRVFVEHADALQAEAFGNATLLVIAQERAEIVRGLERLEGNLTGSIYTARDGRDDDAYAGVASALRPRVGRLLNDKMPTGVAVSPAMHHGGPFPASGHPHFTAVGIPASLRRFTRLACYDGVRPERLPGILRNASS